MSPRISLLATAALGLLLAGCGDDKVATYRVPKEKDPEMPGMAAAAGGDQAATAGAPAGPDMSGAGMAAPAADGSSMANTAVPTAEGNPLTWSAPSGWTAKPAGAMRKGSFTVPGPAGDSDLSITAFPGDVGGELANVNRWRGQIGMGPLKEQELNGTVVPVQVGSLNFLYTELIPDGDAKVKGILGAMVPFGGGTWFFKLTGPKGSLQANKQAFAAFLHGIKTP